MTTTSPVPCRTGRGAGIRSSGSSTAWNWSIPASSSFRTGGRNRASPVRGRSRPWVVSAGRRCASLKEFLKLSNALPRCLVIDGTSPNVSWAAVTDATFRSDEWI